MLDYLLRQGMLLIFTLVGFLIMFNRLATPEQKKSLKPALKELPRTVKYVLGEFIYQMKKRKRDGASKDEKIHDISNYRQPSRGLWRKRR